MNVLCRVCRFERVKQDPGQYVTDRQRNEDNEVVRRLQWIKLAPVAWVPVPGA